MTPTAEDLIRLDRQRRGKTLSNEEWVSKTDPEARIARMKDGTTHLAYKPEHAVDLDTGAVVAAEVHAADEGDTTTITGTLDAAQRNLTRVGAPPSSDDPAECVADKGYHARAVLKGLDQGPWKTRIAEPQRQGVSRWHGDTDARRAVYNNRTRLRSAVGKQAMRQRAELVERSFAHILDRGGMRRTWLRGRENVHKRYLIHVAGHNLGLLMRLLMRRATEGSRGAWLVFSCPAPDQQWRVRGSHHGSRRPQRHPSSDRREHALRPSLRLNKHFVNGLLNGGAWKTRIAEPQRQGVSHWRGR